MGELMSKGISQVSNQRANSNKQGSDVEDEAVQKQQRRRTRRMKQLAAVVAPLTDECCRGTAFPSAAFVQS